jgi:hypothetical protein
MRVAAALKIQNVIRTACFHVGRAVLTALESEVGPGPIFMLPPGLKCGEVAGFAWIIVV